MRTSITLIALALVSVVTGCEESESDASHGDAGTSVSGAPGAGSPVTTGAPSGVDGGGTTADSGGSSSGGSSSGGSSSGGADASSSGGAATGGAGGMSDAGSAGSGADGGATGNATGCTRELLKQTIDAYFRALAAHDPAMLPLADGVKFTENGKPLAIGEAPLWKSAGALKYVHSALDTETCQSASQAVVPDGTMDIPVALRLKLQNQKLTEIETIAVRPGDYTALGSPFPSNTGALAASSMSVEWEKPVPAEQRNSRVEITGWIDKYFRMFPRGVCNVASSCKRIENGGGSFNCALGASCAEGQPRASDNALKSRLLFADVETGVGVGFTMFMGNTDVHMYKMYGGQIHGVSAILGRAQSSGWD